MIKVKVQAKKSTKDGKEYKTLYVAIPSDIADILGIREGDILYVTIKTVDMNGKNVQAIVYYKP